MDLYPRLLLSELQWTQVLAVLLALIRPWTQMVVLLPVEILCPLPSGHGPNSKL